MNVLLDTSVLVAALVKSHPNHSRALPWLKRVADKDDIGFVALHSLAEVDATLTRLPDRPRINPRLALRLIQENTLGVFQVVTLAAADYTQVLEQLTEIGVIGGATYDALILKAAANAGVDQVVTFNEGDFRRVYPAFADKIIVP